MDIKSTIRSIEDYPSPGISFKDITTLLKNKEAFKYSIDTMVENIKKYDIPIDYIVGIEARGLLLGSAVAYALGVGFIPARKPGKLPSKTVERQYELEYGQAAIQIHEDAINKGDNIIIVDDLLATGGTAQAVEFLVKQLEGNLVGFEFLIELDFLDGRSKLDCKNINVQIHY